MKKLIPLLLISLLFSGCPGVLTPKLPQDVADLRVPNCIKTPDGFGISVVDWEGMSDAPLLEDTPFEMELKNEYLELSPPPQEGQTGGIHCWYGVYNWNQGKVEGERERITLNPAKTYVILEIDGLIAIVKYLIENIWQPVAKTFGLA